LRENKNLKKKIRRQQQRKTILLLLLYGYRVRGHPAIIITIPS
jgi:hypothetical protein